MFFAIKFHSALEFGWTKITIMLMVQMLRTLQALTSNSKSSNPLNTFQNLGGVVMPRASSLYDPGSDAVVGLRPASVSMKVCGVTSVS